MTYKQNRRRLPRIPRDKREKRDEDKDEVLGSNHKITEEKGPHDTLKRAAITRKQYLPTRYRTELSLDSEFEQDPEGKVSLQTD